MLATQPNDDMQAEATAAQAEANVTSAGESVKDAVKHTRATAEIVVTPTESWPRGLPPTA